MTADEGRWYELPPPGEPLLSGGDAFDAEGDVSNWFTLWLLWRSGMLILLGRARSVNGVLLSFRGDRGGEGVSGGGRGFEVDESRFWIEFIPRAMS